MTPEQSLTCVRRAFLKVIDDEFSTQASGAKQSSLIRLGCSESENLGPSVCAFGAFDGIHRGHRYLFSRTIEDARARGAKSVIVTFDPDPDELFKPLPSQRKILSNEDRIEYLRRFAADAVVVIPFTADLASNTAQDFIDKVIGSVLDPVAIHVGADFRLGVGNEGSVESLRVLGETRSFVVHGHDLRMAGSLPVSATRIRDLLQKGAIDEANDLLCRPHFVRGTVEQGRHQGATFGFPTANIQVRYPYALPGIGVYAGFVRVGDTAYPAAINVGAPRTFSSDNEPTLLEANLLGFSGDLYGAEVSAAFVRRLRPQRKFDTIEELIAVVTRNIEWVSKNLGSQGIAI